MTRRKPESGWKKVSSIERVKTNVDKETGDRIRAMGLEGVKSG